MPNKDGLLLFNGKVVFALRKVLSRYPVLVDLVVYKIHHSLSPIIAACIKSQTIHVYVVSCKGFDMGLCKGGVCVFPFPLCVANVLNHVSKYHVNSQPPDRFAMYVSNQHA